MEAEGQVKNRRLVIRADSTTLVLAAQAPVEAEQVEGRG